MIIFRSILFLLIFILLPSHTYAWSGHVVAVTDGDTIQVTPLGGGKRVKIRLYGIDTPERKQSFGNIAKAFVTKVALYMEVDVKAVNTDRYGRLVAIIFFPNGESLQEILLQEGLAWVWPKYCKTDNPCKAWKALQKESKQEKKGLWDDFNPIEPWKWRRR